MVCQIESRSGSLCSKFRAACQGRGCGAAFPTPGPAGSALTPAGGPANVPGVTRAERAYGIALAWGGNVVAIVALSVWGRPLLAAINRAVPREMLGVILLGVTLGALGAVACWLSVRRGAASLLHLLWLVPVGVGIELFQETLEERIHVPLFGLLGFLSARLWPPGRAVLLGLGIAAGDEVLQAWLPDRVGEWRDVAVNGTAALMGTVLAILGRRSS